MKRKGMKTICCLYVLLFLTSGFKEVLSSDVPEVYVSVEKRILPQREDINGPRGTALMPTVVITKAEIERLPVDSIADLLSVMGFDVQSRGDGGVQSDISVRGSTFEQTRVLIDGTEIRDPQTGHHKSDFPVSVVDIERIEIYRGLSGGTVNIVTRTPAGRGVSVGLSAGDYGTYRTAVNLSAGGVGNTGAIFNRRDVQTSAQRLHAAGDNRNQTAIRDESNPLTGYLTVSRDKSDGYPVESPVGTPRGYRYDFDIINLFSKITRNNNVNLSLGYTDKVFGAYDFYTPGRNFPSRESTKTYFAKLDASGRTSPFRADLSFRRHHDTFVLIENKPSVYTNVHTNNSSGGNVVFSPRNLPGTDFGIEPFYDDIESTGTKGGLGRHNVFRCNVWAAWEIKSSDADNSTGGVSPDAGVYPVVFNSFKVVFRGGYNNFNFNTNTIFLPELYADFKLAGSSRMHFYSARSYRLPSFTELYYEDLVNKGDTNLRPEVLWNHGAGWEYNFRQSGGLKSPAETRTISHGAGKLPGVGVNLFVRDEVDVLDWVESPAGSRKYVAMNIGGLRRQGFEVFVDFHFFRFEYCRTDNLLSDNYELSAKNSKYALRNPVNYVSATMLYDLPFGFRYGLTGVYKERQQEKGYAVYSLKLSRKVHGFEIGAKVENLLDERYEEIPGVVQPGRWTEFSISYNF
ncbi:MAG: TonB-dependent receptor plug domain-containing protein [Elusimicrobiota bacterium]